MPLAPSSSVPVITNPLSLYRSLINTKQISPEPSQHRLALHLQKLYFRLIDYSPQLDYKDRLRAISQFQEQSLQNEVDDTKLAVPGHPIWRNPLFSHLFSKKQQRDSLALTRKLTNFEEAIELQTPRGLLVHGEVGSGKSMLVDMLADGLPNEKKKRWHFNTFMLETFAKLEQNRRLRSQKRYQHETPEHSLLWLAKDIIEKSPILFIDEFQLPDRAASKIICQLLTAFFQLGGVLIATSNRMPDELSKSSGVNFIAPSTHRVIGYFPGFNKKSHLSTLSTNNEYAGFIEVLKARCEIWNMEGKRDWRRNEAEQLASKINSADEIAKGDFTTFPQTSPQNAESTKDVSRDLPAILPQNYFLKSSENKPEWDIALKAISCSDATDPIIWKSQTFTVYARELIVPRHYHGVTFWTFKELCGKCLGPADYIVLASKFHTFVLDEVPVMNFSQKNEARRLITLLDALYESRCKLVIRAEAGPDDLFFPELSAPVAGNGLKSAVNEDQDAVYSETIAEIYQDKISPFRPNIVSYSQETQNNYKLSNERNLDSVSEKGVKNKTQINFRIANTFTGEDERFAYKRARSRLWEMCGAKWHARSGAGWWRPLPAEVRSWEYSKFSRPHESQESQAMSSDIKMGDYVELDKPAGLNGREIEENNTSQKNSCQCKANSSN
ncbi:Lactation elevated protein 1-like protein B [Golovinomyces cichoracearum]|uniref:Lactation elevated protein 1-like protein B n=1 Tax=Golovinomyces cichoracearum TaxID=62708 RepID=A0A420IC08_9PEZI|nr:Lactation elevated protein 1-like protein B [Golovinomyces cichoracearum]